MTPDRCWWCDRSRPKAEGLCLTHAWLFGHNPGLLAAVHAEIRGDRPEALGADAAAFVKRAALIVAGILAVNALLRLLGAA